MLLMLAAALLLPGLFPLSMLGGALFDAARTPTLRAVGLLVLPALGALLLTRVAPPPAWRAALQWLALGSALLYAWRLLGVRELFVWARLQAVSASALVWLAWLHGISGGGLLGVAAALVVPAVLLALLAGAMQRRVGAAYLGLRGNLAAAYPRWGAALAWCLLAVLALPPFPGFVALVGLLRESGPGTAAGVLLTWLAWSWAGALLWRSAGFGEPWTAPRAPDLGRLALAAWMLAGAAFVLAGLLGSATW
jgi:hypothetical protein